MAKLSCLLLLAVCAAFVLVASADDNAATHSDSHDTHASTEHDEKPVAMLAGTPAPGTEEVVAPFSAMQYGILIIFVLMWMVYYFIYFFEFDSAGNNYLFSSSYVVLVILIASGLGRYFTGSILTAVIAMSLLGSIAFSGFAVMMTISTPDRFEGDKSNMGRTRLEN